MKLLKDLEIQRGDLASLVKSFTETDSFKMKLSIHVALYAYCQATNKATGSSVWSNELHLKYMEARKGSLCAKFKISFNYWVVFKDNDLALIIILSMTGVSRCKMRKSSNLTSRVCLTVQMKN